MTDKMIKVQEDVTLASKDSKIKLFGVVGNDRVFLKVDARYEKDIPNLEVRVINGCDHWLIVENSEAVDKAPAEFLDTIKVLVRIIQTERFVDKFRHSDIQLG